MKNNFLLLIRKVIRRIWYIVKQYYKLNIIKDPKTVAYRDWVKDERSSALRLEYPLTEDSIVLDVGGYIGQWSQDIIELYNPYIYIFEPVNEYFSKIKSKFESNTKVFIYNFGLSDKNMTQKITILNDSSSIFRAGDKYTNIQIKDIFSFINENNISEIDLIKINIEGGEYPLLKRMIDTKLVHICKNIQVQFHEFYPNAVQLRNEMREDLRETHKLTYDYPFIWENWLRK